LYKSNGVGTHIATASTSLTKEKSVVAFNFPSLTKSANSLSTISPI